MPTNPGKSLITLPSMTMKAGMTQRNSSNQSRLSLHLKASRKRPTGEWKDLRKPSSSNTRKSTEAKFLVTKNVNSISLARNEEEEDNKTDETPDNTKMPAKTEIPVRKAEAINGDENGAGNESIKTPKNDEAVKASISQPVAYYWKHKINEKLIKRLVENNRFNNSLSGTRVGKKKGKAYKVLPWGPISDAVIKKKITKKEDIEGNFEIPCSI
ncbi:hypothetical protein Tco_0723652 [Tanacetum coccineum]